ncbi:hypothetical protein BLNAU_17536 [Blattamonas nauphoetae]|uniref:Uncharacterized protein n=1 Tax=Blattamonas nauphoetae TaxID=2049346 RepID=A0ABQ9XB55_9EUKA|nr:hypothetical protein BLNAU_17536 [Blattamonas nauphoetae]
MLTCELQRAVCHSGDDGQIASTQQCRLCWVFGKGEMSCFHILLAIMRFKVPLLNLTNFPRVNVKPNMIVLSPVSQNLPFQLLAVKERPGILSLAEVLTAVSRKLRELGEIPLVPVPNTNKQQVDYPTFQSDVLFLLANCPQPVTNALKKAVVTYINEASNVAEVVFKVSLLILAVVDRVEGGALDKRDGRVYG